MLRTLRSFVGEGDEQVLYECRHCGTTVDGAGDSCPNCGGGNIARFLL